MMASAMVLNPEVAKEPRTSVSGFFGPQPLTPCATLHPILAFRTIQRGNQFLPRRDVPIRKIVDFFIIIIIGSGSRGQFRFGSRSFIGGYCRNCAIGSDLF